MALISHGDVFDLYGAEAQSIESFTTSSVLHCLFNIEEHTEHIEKGIKQAICPWLLHTNSEGFCNFDQYWSFGHSPWNQVETALPD